MKLIPPANSASPSPASRGMVVKGLALAAVLGVCIGTGLFLVDHSNATSYMSNDPNACVNCHIMRDEFDGWQHSTHHAVAVCNDCHVPHDFVGKYTMKAVHGYRHSKGFTFQDFHEPILIKEDSLRVVENNCIRCHADLTGDINTHGLAVKPGDDSLSCVHCHSHVGHGPNR